MPECDNVFETQDRLETIPDKAPADKLDLTTYDIPIDEILIDDQFNCRDNVTSASVFNLAADIERNGLQQPVSVRPLTDEELIKYPGKKFALIMGFRRTKSCQILDWKTVPAMIKYVDARRARVLNIGENLHRKDLTFYEEAASLRELFHMNMSRDDIAKETSQSPGWVQRRLLVWQLPIKAQELVRENILGAGDLQALYKYKDPEELDRVLNGIRQDFQLNAKVDENGKVKFKVRVPKPKIARTFDGHKVKRTRNKKEMIDLLMWLDEVNFPKGPYNRVLAWCTGEISDGEVLKSFIDFAKEYYEMDVPMPINGVPEYEH